LLSLPVAEKKVESYQIKKGEKDIPSAGQVGYTVSVHWMECKQGCGKKGDPVMGCQPICYQKYQKGC